MAQPLGSSSSPFPYASFAAPQSLPTGYIPTAVVQGDFNGDGKVDLAISNGGDGTIYVYLGNGDESFQLPEVLYTKGQSPVWLAAAQLRKNGPTDLIAVDGDSNQVEVFYGKGDGTFQASTIVTTTPEIPTFIVAGDFNKDGNTDLAIGLVVYPGGGPQFEVLMGDGTGAFPTVVTSPAIPNDSDSPIPTNGISIGDMNNDGYPDVLTAVNWGFAYSYLNHGGTGFEIAEVDFTPINGTMDTILADLGGNSCPYVLESDQVGTLTVAKGNCDGTFANVPQSLELGDLDPAMVMADVNGDGHLDLIASSVLYHGQEASGGIGAVGGYLVSVLEGDGQGNLGPPALYRVAPDAYDLIAADLKGDGFPDIITISQSQNTASILVNNGRGEFNGPAGEAIGYLALLANAPNVFALPQTFDVNGDGKPDVVLVESNQQGDQPSWMTSLLNEGTGRLGPPIRSSITVGPDRPYAIFAVGKFRSTSPADVIYVNGIAFGVPGEETSNVAFMPGKGDGTFGAPVTLSTMLPDPLLVATGDFNGDGILDFVVVGHSTSYAELEFDTFLGNGDGTFKELSAQTFPVPTTGLPTQLIAGDFNHDGKLDLLIGYTSNGYPPTGDDLDLALGNGDGTFQAAKTLMPDFGAVAVADLNGDGYLDLVQTRDPDASLTQNVLNYYGVPYFVAAATVYLGGSGGKFTKQATYTFPGFKEVASAPALIGDFNGDGIPDVAVPYQITLQSCAGCGQRLEVLQGNGDGTFAPSGVPYVLPDRDNPIVGGDYRGVGVTDLLDLVGATSSINTLSAANGPPLAVIADTSPLTDARGQGTVSLALPAKSSETVQLTASDPAVTLSPASLTFTSGQSQQKFTFAVGSGFDASHLLAISATLNGQTASGYFVKANPNAYSAVMGTVSAYFPPGPGAPPNTYPGGSNSLLLIVSSFGNYSGSVGNFTCAGLPAGAQCRFAEPNMTLTAGGTSDVAFEISTTSGTPVGVYNITITASNDALSIPVSFPWGVGGFSLSASPSIVQTNQLDNIPTLTVTATFTDDFNQTVTLTCAGLPSGASCITPTEVSVGAPSESFTVAAPSSLAAQDYPFQVVGTYEGLASQTSATLRVSSFSASLQPASVTIANPGSSTVNVILTSLNHFSNSRISIACAQVAYISCSTANQYATLTDGGTATVVLTVNVAAPQSAMAAFNGARVQRAKPMKGVPWAVALASILAIFLPSTRKSGTFRQFLGGLAVFVLLASVSSCGGGGGSGGGGGGGGGSQTLTVAVSAQAQVNGGTLQISAGTLTITATK
ncbi:MAG TPA: VCBS repeat-containing protein [Terracidiphilus sp.]|nr:VCBS repeat-containing protein [Terracidiphilus sp.]